MNKKWLPRLTMKSIMMFTLCLVANFISASGEREPLLSATRNDDEGYFPAALRVQFETGLDAYNAIGVKSAIEGGHIVKAYDLNWFKHRSRFRSLKLGCLITFQLLVPDAERVEHFRLKMKIHNRRSELIKAVLHEALRSQQ